MHMVRSTWIGGTFHDAGVCEHWKWLPTILPWTILVVEDSCTLL